MRHAIVGIHQMNRVNSRNDYDNDDNTINMVVSIVYRPTLNVIS